MAVSTMQHEFNLVPFSWRFRREATWVLASIAVTIGIVLSPLLWVPVLERLGEVKRFGAHSEAVLRLVVEKRDLTDFFGRVEAALGPRTAWSDDLIVLGSAAANRVWLTKVTIDGEARRLDIVGNAHSTRAVADFMGRLKDASLLGDVEMSVQPGADRIITFTLTGAAGSEVPR